MIDIQAYYVSIVISQKTGEYGDGLATSTNGGNILVNTTIDLLSQQMQECQQSGLQKNDYKFN